MSNQNKIAGRYVGVLGLYFYNIDKTEINCSDMIKTYEKDNTYNIYSTARNNLLHNYVF